MRNTKPATIPAEITAPTNRFELAANLALFLVANGQDVNGRWSGRMTAAEQRRVFGEFVGKGLIVVDGCAETVTHVTRVCFGTDYDERVALRCKEAA